MGQRAREIALSVWVLATVSYAWMYSEIQGPNEYTRAYLTAALVDDRTIQIDGPLKRFGTVYDLASHDGHYFSDKAPGSSFLAAPVYALARAGEPPAAWTAQRIVELTRTWLMLPLALLGFVFLRVLQRRLGHSQATIDLVSIGYSLGSPVLHYSTAFYGHVIVAVLLLGALLCMAAGGVLTRGDPPVPPARQFTLLALAGLSAGFAGLTEYQATIVAVLFLLPAVMSGEDRWRASLAYLTGAMPCALALLAYNRAAFGNPFSLSYQHLVGQALRDLHGTGLAGATMPTRDALVGLLFSMHRGLITTAPWFAFGLLGLCVMAPRRQLRALWLTLTLSAIYLFLAVASSSVWFGGWAFGPRLLIPAMPLLAIAAGYALDHFASALPLQLAARACVVVAVVYQQLVHVTFAELPPETLYPLRESVAPLLTAGVVAPNLACKLMPLGIENLIPLALSLALLVGLAIWPRAGSWRIRTLHALGSLGLAGAMLWGYWRVEPATTPKQQADWTAWVGQLMHKETRCKKPASETTADARARRTRRR